MGINLALQIEASQQKTCHFAISQISKVNPTQKQSVFVKGVSAAVTAFPKGLLKM